MKIMNKTSFRQWMLMLAGTVGLAGLMTGCGIYSSYSRPDDLQVDGIYGEPAANADTVSMADIAWRDFFTDPYLQDLIDSVLVNNADMRIAF
ncbi:MAG: hypothetical protein K2I68_04135, partial [Bacteroidales bacterium]|nr:hypothetical protein [Bacteroidales bacterium]